MWTMSESETGRFLRDAISVPNPTAESLFEPMSQDIWLGELRDLLEADSNNGCIVVWDTTALRRLDIRLCLVHWSEKEYLAFNS